MPQGTGLTDFADTFQDRFFDVGIAEEHAVTFAGALAADGIKPVVAIYSTFLQRAYDQIIHDVCLGGCLLYTSQYTIFRMKILLTATAMSLQIRVI